MSICNEVGSKIRRLRKMKGLTQAQLGEEADLHHTYIGAIERGEKNVSVKILEKLARALNVEIKVFFDFSENNSYEYVKEELAYYLYDKESRDVQFVRELLNLLFQWRDGSH